MLIDPTSGFPAAWGTDPDEPSGPMAFGSPEHAQRVQASLPGLACFADEPMAMDDLVACARAMKWPDLWVPGPPGDARDAEDGGTSGYNWYVMPIPCGRSVS